MKRLLNFGFVVVALALLAFATTLRSHSPSDDRSALTTGSAPAKKSTAAAGVNKLPVDEYEDITSIAHDPLFNEAPHRFLQNHEAIITAAQRQVESRMGAVA